MSQEIRHERGAGIFVQFGGRTQLLDDALVHHRNGIGHCHRFFLIVRDMHKGQAHFALDALEFDLHLAAQTQVKRSQRFIQQQHFGFVDQGTGQRHALLLTAGQLSGFLFGMAFQFDQREHVGDLPADILHAAPAQPEGDIVGDAQVRKQRIALKYRVDGPLVGFDSGHVDTADHDPSRARLLEAGNHAQGGRLAAARSAEQTEEGATRHHEIEIFHGDETAKAFCHTLQPQVVAGIVITG